jgi:hypothetical protein
MMGRGTFWAAAAAAVMLAVHAGPATALDDGPTGALGVRVINNNASPVEVWVEDGHGRLRRLGRVAASEVRLLAVPEKALATGRLQVKVYTDEPVWSNAGDQFGVRTRTLDPAELEVIQFWVEPNLERSQVELVRSTATASRSSG